MKSSNVALMCVCRFIQYVGFTFVSVWFLRWRTKQNLDFCFLMMYAQSKGTYYVQV